MPNKVKRKERAKAKSGKKKAVKSRKRTTSEKQGRRSTRLRLIKHEKPESPEFPKPTEIYNPDDEVSP